MLEEARADALSRLSSASLVLPESVTPELLLHASTGDFVALTNQPSWAAGVTHDARIELQPLDVLRERGVIRTTLRHEYAHALIESLGRGRTPRWLAEGLAVHFAGEGATLTRREPETAWGVEEIERGLARPTSREEMRALYAAAYRQVRALVRTRGEAHVWQLVAKP